MYLTNIESIGGDCWSTVGLDLSLLDSWLTISIDNLHLQSHAGIPSIMSQRFLLHTLRIGDYSFKEFCSDLIARDKIIIQ